MGTLTVGTGILCRYAKRYQTTPTNDEKVVGEDTVNLKPSSGNGDRYVPALQVSSAGGNSSPGDASHRGDRGGPSTSYTTKQHCVDAKPSSFRYFGPTATVPGFKTNGRVTRSAPRCRTILGAFYGLLFILLVCQSNIIIASISIASFHTCTPLPHFAQRAPRTMILAILIRSIPFQAPTVLAVLPPQTLGVIGHGSTYLFMMLLPLSLSHQ
jgi:hypothetical protein